MEGRLKKVAPHLQVAQFPLHCPGRPHPTLLPSLEMLVCKHLQVAMVALYKRSLGFSFFFPLREIPRTAFPCL